MHLTTEKLLLLLFHHPFTLLFHAQTFLFCKSFPPYPFLCTPVTFPTIVSEFSRNGKGRKRHVGACSRHTYNTQRYSQKCDSYAPPGRQYYSNLLLAYRTATKLCTRSYSCCKQLTAQTNTTHCFPLYRDLGVFLSHVTLM